MLKAVFGCAVLAALGLGATGTLAAAPASSAMASHSAMSAMAPHSAMASSHMASSAGHATETKMDMMMVHQCHAMPHKKMLKDAECQDYMKHHPDWMKGK